VSLVPDSLRLYPVGRLDADTTGLILLTNDGPLAHRLTHPSFEVAKTYRAAVGNPPVREPALRALRTGIALEDGLTAPADVTRLASDVLELTIHEGRKRQVRRMCEAVGHPVKRLERVAFGPLALGDLRPGSCRRLAPGEVESLASASAGRPARRSAAWLP
jgi:23S rRNA pseudouridine2605 synthase